VSTAVAAALRGAEAVVFAAGAGPGSTAERKWTVDHGAAVTLVEAAGRAGVRRYVMVSAMGADRYDPDSEEIFQVYLHAKSDADRAVRDSALDWTVVRPGTLTDEPATGRVQIAPSTGRGTIPRDDVAALLAACLDAPASIGAQFEVISGGTLVRDAVAAL